MMKKKSHLLWIVILSSSVLLWLTAIVLWIAIPEEKTLNLSTTVCAATLFVISFLMRRDLFKTFYSSLRFKHFSENFFTAILIAAILGLINYLSYKNPFQWDLTANNANTLTSQSKKVLKQIDDPIVAKVFAPKAQQAGILKMLELYQLEKRGIDIQIFDPALRPDLVKEYGLTKPFAVVWEVAGKRQIVTELNELGLTNGLIRLGRESLPKIYYDTGHGQAALTSSEHNGRVLLQQNIVNANYALQETDTKRWERVPEDADVIMIWGPKNAFMPKELELFGEYLKNGGRLIIGIDPDLNQDTQKEFRKFLAERGIVSSNALVVDTLNHVSGSNGTVPIVSKFSREHVMTKDFPGQVFFPLSGFVSLGEQTQGTELAYSSPFPASWAEMSSQEFVSGKVAYNEGVDVKGPLAFAVAAKPKTGGSVLYFANSTFVDNAYARYAANHVFFLNGLSWITGDDQLISFDLAAIDDQPVFISSPQLGVIFFFSVVLAPLTLFGIGTWNYRRRRVL